MAQDTNIKAQFLRGSDSIELCQREKGEEICTIMIRRKETRVLQECNGFS